MDDTTQQVPQEFHIDTSEAQPIGPQTLKDQFEELTGLRSWLARSERELYQCQVELAEREQTGRKQLVNVLALTVELVDEMRRLVADAKRNLDGPSGSGKAGLFGKLFGAGGDLEAAQQWLGTFQRLVAAASNQLEDYGVYHVQLLGENLQELQFEGHPMMRWVAVKGRSNEEQVVVTQEIQGLWVGKLDGQLFPVQRGEVLA